MAVLGFRIWVGSQKFWVGNNKYVGDHILACAIFILAGASLLLYLTDGALRSFTFNLLFHFSFIAGSPAWLSHVKCADDNIAGLE